MGRSSNLRLRYFRLSFRVAMHGSIAFALLRHAGPPIQYHAGRVGECSAARGDCALGFQLAQARVLVSPGPRGRDPHPGHAQWQGAASVAGPGPGAREGASFSPLLAVSRTVTLPRAPGRRGWH